MNKFIAVVLLLASAGSARADALCGDSQRVFVEKLVAGMQAHATQITTTGKFAFKEEFGDGTMHLLISFRDRGRTVFTYRVAQDETVGAPISGRAATSASGQPAFIFGLEQGHIGSCESSVFIRDGRFVFTTPTPDAKHKETVSQGQPTDQPQIDYQWLGRWKGEKQTSLEISPKTIRERSWDGDEGEYSLVTGYFKWSPLQDALRNNDSLPPGTGMSLFSRSQQTRSKEDMVREFEAAKEMLMLMDMDGPGKAKALRALNEAIQKMKPSAYPVVILYSNGEINELVLEGDHIWLLRYGGGSGVHLFTRVARR